MQTDEVKTTGDPARIAHAVKLCFDAVGHTRKDDSLEVLTREGWVSSSPESVVPGHIVLVYAKQAVPADMVVLLSASPDDTCYANYNFFDGDETMQFKSALRLPSVMAGLKDTKDVLELLAPALVERLTTADIAVKKAEPSAKIDEWNIALCKGDGSQVRLVETKETLAHQSVLLLADWVIGLVVYAGAQTKFVLNNGLQGRKEREAKRKADAEKKKTDKENARREMEAKKPSASVRSQQFEAKTGIRWSAHWTDVPDDGNCLVHAFWLGLTHLIKHYPELARPEDKSLASDPEAFRQQCFGMLREDAEFKQGIKALFELFISGVDEAFLIGMEDFFTLPERIRDRVLLAKQQALAPASASADGPDLASLEDWACAACTSPNSGVEQTCGVCGTPRARADVDYDSFVTDYIEAVTSFSLVNGKRVYVPLGASELNALSRLLSVRLQTMTSDGLLTSLGAVTLDEVDPRCIEQKDIHEFVPANQRNVPVQRIVRLLNVRRNHYYVHLPVAPAGSGPAMDTKFNQRNFWSSRYDEAVMNDLPPLT